VAGPLSYLLCGTPRTASTLPTRSAAAQAGRCAQRRLDPALPRRTPAELGRRRRGRPHRWWGAAV